MKKAHNVIRCENCGKPSPVSVCVWVSAHVCVYVSQDLKSNMHSEQ